jgi:uncharacterized protein
MTRAFARIAFTDSVKAAQRRNGARANGERLENHLAVRDALTPELTRYIEGRDSFFMATSSREGWPYVQHRGGPPGFLRVLDERSLAFADFSGNRQYLTQGNLAENPKAHLFLIDYVNRQRIKIWGTARVVENDPELLAKLMPQGYKARPEQVIVFTIKAWDSNCPQHIPQKLDLADVVAVIAERDKRVAELEAEVTRLKSATPA